MAGTCSNGVGLTDDACRTYNCYDKYLGKERGLLLTMNQLDQSLGFCLSQTYRKLTQLLTLRLKEHDITPEQWVVLHQIGRSAGINQKEIAARSAKDQPTTARILDVLGKKGLIEKQMSPADRRAYLVYITAKGEALLEQTDPIESQALADAVQDIEPERVELLRETLNQFRQNIEKLL
jgi:DNA-binding MarR family transcriptional regulator